MKLSTKDREALVAELRSIYKVCLDAGYTPSGLYVKLGAWLKSAPTDKASDDAEELYQSQDRETVEKWLEAVEANIENAERGGTKYDSKARDFVESARSQFEERSKSSKPLTGKQLKWLKALYDKS